MTLSQIFKAYDVRATYPDKLNKPVAWRIGYAAGQHLGRASGRAGGGTVLVGRDMRPHSPALAASLIEGLRASGVGVIDLGMCDTPFIYFAINHLDAAGGIQVTASHNPANYNGFKISGHRAVPVGGDTGLRQIQTIAQSLGQNVGPDQLGAVGSLQEMDLWDEYRKHVLTFLTPPKRPIKVFIDASNGMAGKLVPRVFDGVKHLRIIPLNFEITGSFVHEPNPLVAENMQPTQQGVVEHAADLGVCFDGDADRCIFCDDQGRIIGCDHLTALLTDHFVNGNPGTTIVYDLRSSKVVEETIRGHGAVPRMGRVGHVFMKAALRETQGVFGGELSGHFYFRDNFFADSGAIAFAAVLSVLGESDKPVSELIAPFRKYPQSGEINFKVEDKAGVLQALKDRYADASIDELDGVSIDKWDATSGGGFWLNVRPSNTEPLLRLNVEARDQATLEGLLTEIKPMLGDEAVGH